jgi:hypothetical protein
VFAVVAGAVAYHSSRGELSFNGQRLGVA